MQINCKSSAFFRCCGRFGAILALSAHRYFGQRLVDGSGGLQDALVIHQLFHVGMEVGLGLDAVVDLHEELLVDQRLDAAHGEVRHEVLAVAHVAQIVESVQEVVFEVEEGLWLVVHAEPEHTRYAVAAEESRAVEVHREGLVLPSHLFAGLDDVWNVVDGRAAKEFQRKVDVFGPAVIDEFLVCQVFLEPVHLARVINGGRDVDGKEGSFGVHFCDGIMRSCCCLFCKNRKFNNSNRTSKAG